MAGLSRSAASLAILVVALSTSNEVSAAKIPIPVPVVFGDEEKIAYMGDVPSDVKKQICDLLGIEDVAIGYFYKRFHIFWLDVWTWGGEHVLFKGDQYWKPPPEAWKAILGKEAAESAPGNRARSRAAA